MTPIPFSSDSHTVPSLYFSLCFIYHKKGQDPKTDALLFIFSKTYVLHLAECIDYDTVNDGGPTCHTLAGCGLWVLPGVYNEDLNSRVYL